MWIDIFLKNENIDPHFFLDNPMLQKTCPVCFSSDLTIIEGIFFQKVVQCQKCTTRGPVSVGFRGTVDW